MADLSDLQSKFDADPALAKKFLSDPVGTLSQHGVTLAPQQAFELQQDVRHFTAPAATGGLSPRISFGVQVGIRPPSVSVIVRQ